MKDKYNGKYPLAWSAEQISQYEQSGVEPAKTSNGLWVEDIEREGRELKDWTLAELFALSMGEVYSINEIGTTEYYNAIRVRALTEHPNAMRWSEMELDAWLFDGTLPETTPGGYFISDPDRWVKDASKWDDTELAELGAGYFGELERSHEYILDEISDRFELPVGITFSDYCNYIQKKTPVPVTDSGILINDRRRDSKVPSEWTTEEIDAWLKGEIKTVNEKSLIAYLLESTGGEWYWTKEHLVEWVLHERIPEVTHDYDSYTPEQWEMLVVSDDDIEAATRLLKVDERFFGWDVKDIRPFLVDGIVPLIQEAEEEPEEVVEAPVSLVEDDTVVVDEVIEEVEELVTEESVEALEEEVPESVLEVEVEEEEELEETVEDIPEVDIEEGEDEEVISEVSVWESIHGVSERLMKAMMEDTPSGVLSSNESRRLLSASRWDIGELVAWARDEVPTQLNTTKETLCTALRLLCGPAADNWTNDAVKVFVATHKLPEGYTDGLLMEDIVRDKKHPGDWSDEELRAWCAGRIKTPVERASILFAVRNRFKIPSKYQDQEVIGFIVHGIIPSNALPDIKDPTLATPSHIEAWLRDEWTYPVEMEEAWFEELRLRNSLSNRYTNDQVISYLRHGVHPDKNEDGVQIHDRLRDLTSSKDWNWLELKALAKGEVEAQFSIEDPEVIDQLRKIAIVSYSREAKFWSDDEVLNFIESDKKPNINVDGVYYNDPSRPLREASQWSDAELKAWLRSDIRETDTAPAKALWDEIYRRYAVPVHWYERDAKAFVLEGIAVPSLPSGIWIRDRARDHRPAHHWRKREIKALCRGILLPGVRATEEEIIQHARRVFGISRSLDIQGVKRRIADITEESVTMTIKFVEEELKSYEKGRTDAGNDAIKAAPYQSLLDRCINRILRLDGEDFVQGWTELLDFFLKHSTGILSEKRIYVGVGQMAITPKALRQFQNMTTILSRTCNPATLNNNARLIDWNSALREITSEKTRQQLMAYYGIS